MTTTTTTSTIVTIISPRLVEPVILGRLTQTTRDMDTEEVQIILANNLIELNHVQYHLFCHRQN